MMMLIFDFIIIVVEKNCEKLFNMSVFKTQICDSQTWTPDQLEAIPISKIENQNSNMIYYRFSRHIIFMYTITGVFDTHLFKTPMGKEKIGILMDEQMEQKILEFAEYLKKRFLNYSGFTEEDVQFRPMVREEGQIIFNYDPDTIDVMIQNERIDIPMIDRKTCIGRLEFIVNLGYMHKVTKHMGISITLIKIKLNEMPEDIDDGIEFDDTD